MHLGLDGVHIRCLSQHKAVLTSEASTGFPSLQLVIPGTQQHSPVVKPKQKKKGQKLCAGAQIKLLRNHCFCICGTTRFDHV